ncbi:hypothetical protein RND71_026513 [Anisodus tanguticus]|uniref:Uncharacterized protein n=1 Tax=Anisodus tanguticus TaxID=243964 RepID=A0AAE1RNE6_9SOLA|nr:hypothetical protein RND71_026513 [Anisodus tanguticus]
MNESRFNSPPLLTAVQARLSNFTEGLLETAALPTKVEVRLSLLSSAFESSPVGDCLSFSHGTADDELSGSINMNDDIHQPSVLNFPLSLEPVEPYVGM